MKYIYQARKVSGIDFLSFYDIDFEFWNCSDSVIFFLSFYYFTRENYSNLYNPTTEKPSLSVIRNSSRNTKKTKAHVFTMYVSINKSYVTYCKTALNKWSLTPPHCHNRDSVSITIIWHLYI
jgi:hypothetical protein